MQFLGKILPIDGYEVRLTYSLPTDYINALFHLYQPLIGIEAVNLYQTLLLELDFNEEATTHHTLMNYLNLPLNEIYEARLKLEGIGLLKTYKNTSDEKVVYTYHLQPPFSPKAFFADIMLSELLYRHVGKTKFKMLKAHYTKDNRQEVGEEITVSFGDVFKTYEADVSNYPQAKAQEVTSGIPIESVDLSPIEQALKRKMIPVNNVLTEQNRRIISQLMELYDLETYEIEKSIFWALNDENLLDIEQLKAACHDLFRAKHNVADVTLMPKTERVQQVEKRIESKELSKEEKLIERLETISPRELLEDLSGGNNASEQDMKLISDIMIQQGLPQPVMNVLIHYCLLQSNMKLSKPYLETIASHWSRAKLKTAKEAMEFARKQAEPQPKTQRQYRPRRQTKEVIPDWFKEQKHKKQPQKQQTEPSEKEKFDQEKLMALLKRHASDK